MSEEVRLPLLQPTLAYAVQDKATRDMIRDYARAAIEQERERLAAKWEEAHGFDKHGVAAAIRSGVKQD